MPGPSVEVERHLAEDDLAAAIAAAEADGRPRLVRRLCFVMNCYAGDSLTEAGRRVGASQPTASRWIARWNDAGVDGLEPDAPPGRPSRLSADQRDRLESALAAGPALTAGEVRHVVEAAFDVTYSTRHVYRLLDEFGVEPAGDAGDPEPSSEERIRAVLDDLAGD